MNKNLLLKTVLIVAVLIFFLFGIVGIPGSFTGEGLRSAVQKRIHLGLDLKGGTHLILQVQVNDAINADSDRAVERLKDALKSANVAFGEISKPDPQNHPELVQIKGVPPESSSDLRRIVNEKLGDYDLASGAENTYTLAMKNSVANDTRKKAVQQAIETIRNRIDQLGVSEPVIQEHGLGDYQILVQLPGVDDPARVKEIMQSTAMLEIRQAVKGPYPNEQAVMQDNGGVLPPDTVLMKGTTPHAQNPEEAAEVYWLISRSSAVSGADLRSADAGRDENGRPDVNFTLTGDGGRRFAAFTQAHVGDKLAVVLDNKVKSVATIQEQIHDQGRITGSFSPEETQDLALTLRSGALPAGIKYLQEVTVGPSLGADSIREGVRAAVIGMVAVLIFMLFYYRAAGINADLGLVLNLVILLGFLGYSGATLTLPGIAGVILTVGMGVDSNVLIFERIREELRHGKTPSSSVEQGFHHAMKTIIDTHVTTIVSAIILFLFGTGPVKGFAVTLSFGLAANLFTAVFVSRVIFEFILSRHQRGEPLSI
ncbi:MAG: protein translocase subunit SecD [Candidatus Korobacteraceae bacterium]|jgi:preprotein translocase subunit SecD